MSLQEYITESEKQYHLRLKTIVPVDDAVMDRLENSLAKYNPLMISRPVKTILQRAPLDFPNVEAAEVYIVDMTFGMPAAPHILRADIRKLLDAPENYVFVRDCNEPGEIETLRLNALADIELEAERRGLRQAAVLTDPDYSEGEDYDTASLFGNDYNEALISYLSSVEKERRGAVARVETAPFKWLDLPDRDPEPVSGENYNAHIKDAPFVTLKPKKKVEVGQSVLGSFNQSKHIIRRLYVDNNGKKVVLSRELAGEQK